MSTRRNLLAFTAGAVAVLPLAAKAAETHPDRELLSACASFNAIEAEVQRINGKKGAEYDDDEMDIAIAAWYDALEVAHRVSARTPAGLKAKGTIAHLSLRMPWRRIRRPRSREEFFAHSVLYEMKGMASA